MKIGIMGGTFNPIHFGHLLLAEKACEQMGLNKVLFMPSKNPPHKPMPAEVSEQQRVDMITLAIQDHPLFELSTFELSRDGFTYTADTLTLLKQENPDIEYYFIVGTDSLFYMDQWKDPQIIFDLCTILVAGRDYANQEEIDQYIKYLNTKFGGTIQCIDMPMIEISSANIRERILKDCSVRNLMPSSVIQYIEKQKLYT